MAVFLFYGQEEFLIEKEIRKLKGELLDSSFASMGYKVFNNPAFNDLLDVLCSSPLMFGNTLNIIHIDKYFIGNKLSLDDKQLLAFENSLKTLSDNVNIVFVCKIPRDENKKPDSRKKIYKIISKYSLVKEFAQYKTYQKELNNQIMAMAKDIDLKLTSDIVSMLIEQLGSNLTLINSELEKLKIAIYPNKAVTKEDVRTYCTSSEDIFILADLIVQGKKDEVLKQYNLLTDRHHPLEIFSILQENFRKFIYIKNYEKKYNIKEIASNLRVHEFVAMKIQEKIKKISLERLLKLRGNFIKAEYKLKSGLCVSGETVLELALLG